MEKDHQPDSMATVAMKPEYPPSEVYSTSEPPPAYRHPRSTAVQIARIVAFTIILSSMLLGSFLLAASYVQARASCQHLDQLDALLDKELLLDARMMQADDELSRLPGLPQALHQDDPTPESSKKIDLLHSQTSVTKDDDKLQSLENHDTSHDDTQESNSQSSDSSSDSSDSSSESGDSSSDSSDSSDESSSDEIGRIPIRITLPLQLDLDDLAGALMEKNQRSRMNCVVEKRRAEELVDHQARSVQLPFGLNLTTEPRLEKVTGERMAIFCESGNEQRIPENVEVLNGFPVPLGGPVRLPLQFPVPPMPAYRPPMPAQHMQAPAPQAPQEYESQSQEMPQHRAFPPQFIPRQNQFAPQPQRILFHIKEQMPQERQLPFQLREPMTAAQVPFLVREQEPQQQQINYQEVPRPQIEIREQMEQMLPPQVREQIREHIREQLINQQQHQQAQMMREQMSQPQQIQFHLREHMQPQPQQQMPVFPMREQAPQQDQEQIQIQRLPLQMALVPREVRIHVQRVQLPQVEADQVPQDSHASPEEHTEMDEMVYPTMKQEDYGPLSQQLIGSYGQNEEMRNKGLPMISPEELRAVQQAVRAAEEEQEHEQREQEQREQEQREREQQAAAQQQAEEIRADVRNSMMERQAMARALPVDIPVPMMTKEQEAPVQDPERPHYVQPRSVRSTRSVDSLLHREKRVKRCTCDCAC